MVCLRNSRDGPVLSRQMCFFDSKCHLGKIQYLISSSHEDREQEGGRLGTDEKISWLIIQGYKLPDPLNYLYTPMDYHHDLRRMET